MYLNFKDFSSVFIWYFESKNCIFANKYSISNIPNFILYSKHKIQNVQGNPALIFNIFAFVLHKKLWGRKNREKVFLDLLLWKVDTQPIGAQAYIRESHPGLKFAPH